MDSTNKKLQEIAFLLKKQLPGRNAQEKMYPTDRKDILQNAEVNMHIRNAAVLLHLFPVGDDLYFILTQRKHYLREHAGQISFPGGSYEEIDKSLMETALREANEEIGIDRTTMYILGELTEVFIPNSNFLVRPFVSFSHTKPILKKDSDEVEEILLVPLSELLDISNQKEMYKIKDGKEIRIPYYLLQKEVVWGATAIILSEFREMLVAP